MSFTPRPRPAASRCPPAARDNRPPRRSSPRARPSRADRGGRAYRTDHRLFRPRGPPSAPAHPARAHARSAATAPRFTSAAAPGSALDPGTRPAAARRTAHAGCAVVMAGLTTARPIRHSQERPALIQGWRRSATPPPANTRGSRRQTLRMIDKLEFFIALAKAAAFRPGRRGAAASPSRRFRPRSSS